MSGVLLYIVALRVEPSIPQIVDRCVKYVQYSALRLQTVGKCKGNVWEDSRKEHVFSLPQERIDTVWHAVRKPAVIVRVQWSHGSLIRWNIFSIAISLNYTNYKRTGTAESRTVRCFRRVQPTKCNDSRFIHFCKTLYMFQTVFPSIIRSSKLHIQRQVFAGSSIGLTNTWRCMCSFELLMMEGKTVWNM